MIKILKVKTFVGLSLKKRPTNVTQVSAVEQ